MVDEKTYIKMRGRLMEMRTDILSNRLRAEDEWQNLQDPEIELEETAAKASLSRTLESVDEQDFKELEEIDNALAKLDKSDFGKCEICRRPISEKRLNALPWARHCIQCAGARENFSAKGIEENPVKLGDRELTDDEMLEAIFDALREEGGPDTEELDIRCNNGVVYLNGIIPAESTRDALLHIIEDILGFDQVVDNLTIDRTPWEQTGRSEIPVREKTEVDIMTEGEDKVVDTEESLETGEPMTPPDRLKPEKH